MFLVAVSVVRGGRVFSQGFFPDQKHEKLKMIVKGDFGIHKRMFTLRKE